MTLAERLQALQEAFTGKSAEAEAKGNEVASLSAKVEELTSGLASKEASIVEMTAKVAELSAALAAAEEVKASAEAKAQEILASQETAGKKAAAIAASVGVQPVEILPVEIEAAAKSDSEISEEWVSLKQKDAKAASDYYTKHRLAILRAAGLR